MPRPVNLGPKLALEAVSQAAAMAAQDAMMYFSTVTAVNTAAATYFTVQMAIEEQPDPWVKLIAATGKNITEASTVMSTVAADAASLIKAFAAVAGS